MTSVVSGLSALPMPVPGSVIFGPASSYCTPLPFGSHLEIGSSEIDGALDRVMAGPRRRSRVLSEREKLITAYHETGHALVAAALPQADPVHKVSIISRGIAGGYTRFVPEQDRNMGARHLGNVQMLELVEQPVPDDADQHRRDDQLRKTRECIGRTNGKSSTSRRVSRPS